MKKLILILFLLTALTGMSLAQSKQSKPAKKSKPEKTEKAVETPKTDTEPIKEKQNTPAEVKEDLSQKPAPLPQTDFVFPDYQEITTKNGVKLIVIEDHEQPTISVNLLIPGGTSVDAIPGQAEMTAALMTKGFGKYSALDFASKLDGVGARVSAIAGNDFFTVSGFSLKKHLSVLTEMFGGAVSLPAFNEDEFEKLIPQLIAEVQQEKSNTSSLAARMARIALYGPNHPYSAAKTEESIKNIKVKDIKSFYNKYIIPNNATMAIVGDIKPSEALELAEKMLANWHQGVEQEPIQVKIKSLPIGVYFVNRPAAVQSSVVLTSMGVTKGHPDYEALDIATSVMGGGFGGRLFRTLREKYSYTYTPFGYLTTGKYGSRIASGADVRNSVTDSAINVIKEQLGLLASVPAEDAELDRIKKSEVGNFKMRFENADDVASMIQTSEFYEISPLALKEYPQRVMSFDKDLIKTLAERYMNPKNSYIIVVGNPEIRSKLDQFGKVYEYDLDLNPITGESAKMEKASLDAGDLIEKYTKAIGGKDNLALVKSLVDSGKVTMTVNGRPQQGTIYRAFLAPDKEYMNMDLPSLRQVMMVDGRDAYIKAYDNVIKLEAREAEKLLFDAVMFNATKLLDLKYKCKVLGRQGNSILMTISSPLGNDATYYFDAQNFLLQKIEKVETSINGTIPFTELYTNYQKVGNLLLPLTIETNSPTYNLKLESNYKINQAVDESLFKVK